MGLRARLWWIGLGAATMLGGAVASCSNRADSALMATDGGPDEGVNAPAGDAREEASSSPGRGTLQILALADLRGQLDPIVELGARDLPQTYGGLETLATYFARDRARAGPTMVVSAGDAFGASPILSSAFDDEPTARGLDLLGATAGVLGEHDFSRGTEKLANLLALGSFRAVSTNLSNVVFELGPRPVTPFMLVDVGGGADSGTTTHLRVAVLGLTNPSIAQLQFPANMGIITVTDPVGAANKAAQDARLLGADLVIALAHVGASGIDAAGAPVGPLMDLAGRIHGVDLLVGGQSDVEVSSSVGAMAVVQPRSKGRSYARVVIAVDGAGVHVQERALIEPLAVQTAGGVCDAGIDADADADAAPCACPAAPCENGFVCNDASLCEKHVAPPDDAATALLSSYRDALPAALDQPIAVSDASLAEDGSEQARETALGDLVADALLAKYAKPPGAAQIALVPGARIHASLPSSYVPSSDSGLSRDAPPYALLVGDTQLVLPFGDAAVVRTMTGARLRDVLERSVAAAPAPSPSFLQVAGITLTYSSSTDAGARLVEVTLTSTGARIPPGDSTEYVVVLPDWTSRGRDGYAMLAEDGATPGRDLLVDIFAEYIKSASPLGAPAPLTRIVAVP